MNIADIVAIGSAIIALIVAVLTRLTAIKKADAEAVHNALIELTEVRKDVEWILKFVPRQEGK